MAMKSSPIIHTLPYPTIEDGSLSFPDGSYEVKTEMMSSGNAVIVSHIISDAPFLSELIESGNAQFGCLLSVPKTGYRKLFFADSKAKEQKIEWDLSIAGEAPKLRPILLYVGDEEKKYEFTKDHGVAEIWWGRSISIPKGARLARTNYFVAKSEQHKLITFSLDEELENGSFEVEPKTEGSFCFGVKASRDLFNFIQNDRNKNCPLRWCILTHITSRCFEILKEDYSSKGEDGWENFPNLRALSEKLKGEIGYDWDDEYFKPELAATLLYPLRIPKGELEEDE